MEFKQIKELMTAMGRTGTKRLQIKKENFELVLEREELGRERADNHYEFSDEAIKHSLSWNRAEQALSRGAEMPAGRATSPISSEPVNDGVNSKYVSSPMVGTFYTAPSPDDPSFVKVGEKVDKNTVVCIIEAMKVMNEIKAQVAGVITEVLVETGQPVEFGTKLFRIQE